jgi:hypothetical protein
LNLPAGKLLINLQVLLAMRTGKFEIAHWMSLAGFVCCADSRPIRGRKPEGVTRPSQS